MRSCLFIALFVFFLVPGFTQAQHRPTAENPAMILVPLGHDPEARMAELCALDQDIACVDHRGREVHVVADASDLDLLTQRGVPFIVQHLDLVAFYQSRFNTGYASSRGLGSMGGFYTFDEVKAKLDEYRALYPNLITAKTSIGKSHENRNIWAVKISDNPDQDENEPEAAIDALTHAREPQGMMSTLYFMEWLLENYPSDPLAKFLVENREMWFVPVHNPDGYVYNESIKPNGGGMWRKNRRYNNFWSKGVDLNRNWGYKWGYSNQGSSPDPGSDVYRGPYAMSEPEVQAMADFIIDHNVTERMSIHCFGGYYLIPWCYDKYLTKDDALLRELALEMAPEDYIVGTSWEVLYICNGVTLDWDYGDREIMTFSPEMGKLGAGFWPQTEKIIPICEENLPGLRHFFLVAGSYLKKQGELLNELVGDNNGYPDAGETMELTVIVKNLGILDCSGPVAMSISSSYPHVNILSSSCQIPAVPMRTESDNASQPFVFEILPTAAYADSIVFDLEMDFDGAKLHEEITVILGTPRRMIFDDLEGDATQWWSVGGPGDTALAGIWEWADPNGTWYGNDPAQPEDDHTPAGTHCFVTENGPPGAAPEDYDVDEGKTTLYSPLFDLTGGIMPRVGFHRWYGHPDSIGSHDHLRVAITNDGGTTWVNLERLYGSEHAQWNEVSFSVEDYIAPTDNMRVRFVVCDVIVDSIVEGAVDDFWAECYSTHPVISLYGGMETGEVSIVGLSWLSGAQVGLYASALSGPGITLPGGTWYLNWPFVDLGITQLPANGTAAKAVPIPDIPELVGVTIYFQALAVPPGGGVFMISNLVSGVVEQ